MNYYERTWILCLLVIAGLIGLHFVPPPTVGGITFRRVNLLSDLFPGPGKPGDADLTAVQRSDTAAAQSSASRPSAVAPIPTDSAVAPSPSFAGSGIEDYSGGAPGGMNSFYRSLRALASGGAPVRIAYFGDSFIEGDIFTADFRELLQSRYGGSGVGFVDVASPTAGFRQSVRATSHGFEAHTVTDAHFDRSKMGVNERYFCPVDKAASVTLSGTHYGQHTASAARSTLYFTTAAPLRLTAWVNDSEAETFDCDASAALQSATVKGDIRKVTWTLHGDTLPASAYFYGVTMDADRGVIVDNFSLRGSGGQTLGDLPRTRLQEFVAMRPYDLVVLHFGLNVANAASAKYRYAGYTKQMANIITLFRETMPRAGILVVSVSDRDSRDEDGRLATIEGLSALVSAQQRMAAENGVAFWNLFQAMGGEGSMAKLVHAQPPMANKDYTHLNFRGGRYLARKLYEALTDGADGGETDYE